MTTRRPFPPDSLPSGFLPAPELDDWARATFIGPDSVFSTEDEFGHLQDAAIGWLWAVEPNERKGRMVLGTCQAMPPSGDKWTAARACQQIEEWFGDMPDFIITIYAPACDDMNDASFAALVCHELKHAAQRKDQYGMPMFNRDTGKPVWMVAPHDVEQFVTVVRLFGAEAAMVQDLVGAAAAGPIITGAELDMACGACAR